MGGTQDDGSDPLEQTFEIRSKSITIEHLKQRRVPVLGYWDMRGLAQPIRFLLSYLRLRYDEVVYE